MSDFDQQQTYDLFDSLSPYEVAVLCFTSPSAIEYTNEGEYALTLTCKDAYRWAGVVAHAVIRNPNISGEQFLELLKGAVMRKLSGPDAIAVLQGFDLQRHYYDADVVDCFIQDAGFWAERDLVYRRTEDALRSLAWRGYIEDPLNKRIGAFILSVLMVMPVGFTSKGPNEVHINALTWEYVQRDEHSLRERHLRLKVKEISDVVVNQLVPTVINIFETLSGTADAAGLTNKDVQIKLAQLGYYKGSIDGEIGPKTMTALRQFQRDQYLEVTGHLDLSTIQRLKSA